MCWPGEFRELYNPWGPKESDTTEQLSLTLLGFPSLAAQMINHPPAMQETWI